MGSYLLIHRVNMLFFVSLPRRRSRSHAANQTRYLRHSCIRPRTLKLMRLCGRSTLAKPFTAFGKPSRLLKESRQFSCCHINYNTKTLQYYSSSVHCGDQRVFLKSVHRSSKSKKNWRRIGPTTLLDREWRANNAKASYPDQVQRRRIAFHITA